MPAHRISSTFWRVVTPSVWPEAPRWMSFSTLLELEACPRRWALKAAQYPEVWEHTGYPSVPQSAALEGVVVHSAIERIASALAERGCASLRDESAIETLMELGGYTGIVGECIGRALRQYQGNPRAESVLETVRRGLATHLPELRSRVQRQVSRIRPAVRVSRPISTTIQPERQTRSQIHDGYHVEVEVRVPELAWHGFVDLLALSKDFCEIRDFKTGAMKDAHEFQLRIYAFLWARDHELNPSGRRADKLVLSYNDRDVEVSAPSTEALHSVGEEIRTRTGKASLQFSYMRRRPDRTRRTVLIALCDTCVMSIGSGPAGTVKIRDCRPFDLPTLRSRLPVDTVPVAGTEYWKPPRGRIARNRPSCEQRICNSISSLVKRFAC